MKFFSVQTGGYKNFPSRSKFTRTHLSSDHQTLHKDTRAKFQVSILCIPPIDQLARNGGENIDKFLDFGLREIFESTLKSCLNGLKRRFTGVLRNFNFTQKKSVFEVYEDASVDWEWTETLKKECDSAGVEIMTNGQIETINHESLDSQECIVWFLYHKLYF